jgi:hypothetical protein
MTVEEFEQTLLRYKYHQPFQPFLVELVDGRVIPVLRPKMVLSAGTASFLTDDFELVEFASDEVREIRLAFNGATS